MELRALSWNLFHGRDAPPGGELFSRRSRVLGLTERDATHVQVNRDLFDEFAGVLAGAKWDVALLQECPPRWSAPLAAACDAGHHRSLTSRNRLGQLRSALARANPDLLGANEGGSNTTLIRDRRRPELAIVERLELVLRRRPERRTMAFTRLDCGLCVANLHATNDRPALAEEEVEWAAAAASGWARGAPFLLGGDLNLRPRDSRVYGRLSERFGISAPTEPGAIDHLLVAGMEPVAPMRVWPPGARELPAGGGLALRLSDHAPVEAFFRA